ncbi:hypothetical protein DL95DRAFT_509476 [Leptodontidium sp. 2 PMI_412]|nr:hypothetical protein DL95DRAFT_509476 [Leptodontidium sp. 2 PMI_412]
MMTPSSASTHLLISDDQNTPVNLLDSSSDLSQQPNGEINKVDGDLFSTFTYFPKLPLELRRQIFKEACHVPRVYNAIVAFLEPIGIPSSITNLAILYASSESRATALEVLKPVFDLYIASRLQYDRQPVRMSKAIYGKVLMSANDTVYFTSTCCRGNEWRSAIATIKLSDAAACHRLRTIAFNTDVLKNTSYGPYLWLKVLAWTCPGSEFILVDRLPTQLPEEAVQSGVELQLVDLEEGEYEEFDDEMNESISRLTSRPIDLRVCGILGFDLPITEADFKIPIFKRMGLTLGGVRV